MAGRTRGMIVTEANLANALLLFLGAKILVDPVPHIGRVDDEGKVRKGWLGKGSVVDENTEGEFAKGKIVLYRKESVF